MYVGSVGVFCTMNCYFENRIRILCIFLHIRIYFKCILTFVRRRRRPLSVRPSRRPSRRPSYRPSRRRPSYVRPSRRPSRRRRPSSPSSVVVVRCRRPSKYYLQERSCNAPAAIGAVVANRKRG